MNRRMNLTAKPPKRTYEALAVRLTRMPIVVYYGDNIPAEPTDIAGRDNWRSGSQWPGFGRKPSPARR